MRKSYGYWTKEKCQEAALKYNTRYEFCKKDETAYKKSTENNWLNDICLHMIEGRKPSGFWTKEECLNEAKKYKNRKELKENNKFVYRKCLKNYQEAFEHMEILGNSHKRCGYKIVLHDNNDKKYIYIGLTFNYNLRIEQHLCVKSDIVYRYIQKYNLIVENSFMYHNYIDVEEAQHKEIKEIKFYKESNSHIVINYMKGGQIGGKKISFWTYDKCKECAKSCKEFSIFIENYHVAYNTCRKKGWYDILNNLERKPRGRKKTEKK